MALRPGGNRRNIDDYLPLEPPVVALAASPSAPPPAGQQWFDMGYQGTNHQGFQLRPVGWTQEQEDTYQDWEARRLVDVANPDPVYGSVEDWTPSARTPTGYVAPTPARPSAPAPTPTPPAAQPPGFRFTVPPAPPAPAAPARYSGRAPLPNPNNTPWLPNTGRRSRFSWKPR